jgi:hypothetical protein
MALNPLKRGLNYILIARSKGRENMLLNNGVVNGKQSTHMEVDRRRYFEYNNRIS